MKHIFLLTLISIIALIGCSTGILYIYEYQPIIKIEGDTTEIVFRVPDLNPDGWYAGDGADTESIEITLKETEGSNAYITEIEWSLVSLSNNIVLNDKVMLINPIVLNKDDSLYTVNITLEEQDALDLDEEDGIQDNVGTGVLIIIAKFYDETGENYNSVPFYIPIRVLKP